MKPNNYYKITISIVRKLCNICYQLLVIVYDFKILYKVKYEI